MSCKAYSIIPAFEWKSPTWEMLVLMWVSTYKFVLLKISEMSISMSSNSIITSPMTFKHANTDRLKCFWECHTLILLVSYKFSSSFWFSMWWCLSTLVFRHLEHSVSGLWACNRRLLIRSTLGRELFKRRGSSCSYHWVAWSDSNKSHHARQAWLEIFHELRSVKAYNET